jgi:hypothetical protein
MMQRRGISRLVPLLWMVAALLAWTSVAIRYFGGEGVEWRGAAAGLFCAGMGLAAWSRAKPRVTPQGGEGPGVPPAT